MLGGRENVLHFPLVLMSRLSKTESAVSFIVGSLLFLKDPFFPDYFEAYLVKNNIISNYQSGLRNSFSTDTCFIHLLEYIKI